MDIAALGFEVDSSQARGAAKALAELNSAAINAANSAARIGTAMRDASGRFQSAAVLTAENRHEVERYAKAYNPLLAAQIKYTKEVINTAAAVKAGAIDRRQRIAYLRELKRELDGSAAAERKAAQAREAARREFIPLYAASKQYEESLNRLNAALDAGHLTVQQHKAALNTLNAAYQSSAVASQRFGQSQTAASHHVANLSFQLNDIGMMMASGQSPFMLMIQQGPQVAQIFNQLKQSGQSLGGTLAGAFRMILNPTTLLTLGVIAGTAALYQWLTASEDASSGAKKLGDGIDDLKSKIDSLGSGNFTFNVETGKLEVSLDKIVEKYGTMNSEVARHISLLQEANAVAAGFANLNFMAGFEESFSNTLGYLTTRVDEVRIAFGTTNDAARDLIFLMQRAGEVKGITAQREAADALRDRILNITGGIQNMTAEQVAYFVEVSRAVDQLRIAETQLSRNTAETITATAQTAQWESAMRGVLSYVNAIGQSLSNISGTGIAVAAARVEADMLRQGKTLREAGLAAARETARLEGERRTIELQKQYGLWGKVLGAAESAARQLEISEQASLDILRDQAREREKAAGKSSRGGGGGAKAAARRAAAELKQAEKGFQSLRELLEKDTLFQFAEYEKRQAQLKAALDKRLVTVQQYQEYEAALRIQYFGTEYQQRQLQYDLELHQLRQALEQQLITRQEYDALMRQRQWEQVSQLGQIRDAGTAYELNQMATAFGEAASMAGDYNQKFLKAQRVFAASAALISTYQGAAKALELPFPMNIAAAAKVIAAGLGFVSAIKSGGAGGGSGRGSGTSGAASATTTTPARQEPVRQVLVRLEGDDWLVGMADNIMTQIYEQTKDGRVVVARDR